MNKIASALSSPAWAWLSAAAMVAAYFSAPPEHRYVGAIGSAVTFALGLSLFPACRPITKTPLCPWNWALFLFGLQLVVLPFSVLVAGASVGVLPRLPSESASDAGMLLGALSFLVFSATYQYRSLRRHAKPLPRSALVCGNEGQAARPPRRMVLLYLGLGIMGLFLAFGSPSSFLEYFEDPAKYADQFVQASHTLPGVASLVLRPFLGFGSVMLWCGWLDRQSGRRCARKTAVVTLLAMIAVILSYSTFSYNRGAFVVPLVSMLAVLFARTERVSVGALALAGGVLIMVLLLAPFYAVYRNSGLTGNQPATELLSDPQVADFFEGNIDLVDTMQMYGAGPQYMGYLLEESHWGARPYLGTTLLPSLLRPVPMVGRAIAESNGPAIYNEMIYGTRDIFDQVLPFSGEIFLNFNVVGLVAGFCMLGIVAHWLQRRFEQATSALGIYVWQYTAVWVLFLIIGSISVVSQILFYFFWPIYAYVAAQRAGKRRLVTPSS